MLANPRKMFEAGYIRNLTDIERQIQPNATDFTVDSIQQLDTTTNYVIGEGSKVMRAQTKIVPRAGYFHLDPNAAFDISSNVYVKVPEGKAAILILRSTFVRNGFVLASGLYDSGFEGNIGAVLHTPNAFGQIEVGVRIGQIMFIDSESAGIYAGGYNTKDGQHWKDKA